MAGWKALVLPDREATAMVRNLIAAKFGARDVLLTDSGTAALTLAIRALCRSRPKPLVALPAYGCYDIATAAEGADVEVVLYDLDPRTLGPDAGSLIAALEQRPAAVVLAHLYGIPIDIDPVVELCGRYGVSVIEDAAQGHGAQYGGVPLGAFGAVAVLSFGRGKGVTGGSGGALLTTQRSGRELVQHATPQVAVRHRGVRHLVGATAQWVLGSPSVYGIPASLPFLRLGETIYRDPAPPASITPTAAAVLSRTWAAAERESVCRKQNARQLLQSVEQSQWMDSIAPPPRAEPGYLRLPIIAEQRAVVALASAQARRLGVMPGYPTALADLTGFRSRCRNQSADFAGARTLAARLFTVPTHSRLTDRDVARLQVLLSNFATDDGA
ncbi:MAG: DegT/DnrJ/EryC1/StrS aminotransferase family protein [Gemmatimonadota bacterium]|nr:MAG: DegT/DnrJ/EryC1/StrS aminotransferase family protein [Gemmatimonadota bacterium]